MQNCGCRRSVSVSIMTREQRLLSVATLCSMKSKIGGKEIEFATHCSCVRQFCLVVGVIGLVGQQREVTKKSMLVNRDTHSMCGHSTTTGSIRGKQGIT